MLNYGYQGTYISCFHIGFIKSWYVTAGDVFISFQVKQVFFDCLQAAVGKAVSPGAAG
jgi:hypothetical protein